MQYTFEQENSLEKPLKVIMEVTYKDGVTKWFQVLLQNEGVQIPVKRNHLYRINIKRLGKNLGYTNSSMAYDGTPANNPWITVEDIIQEISDGTYTMNIVNGTYQMLTQESANSDQVIDFEFLLIHHLHCIFPFISWCTCIIGIPYTMNVDFFS